MKIKGKEKRGISLIVLVITIIIMIILAAAVILSLNSSDVVSKASEAKDKSDTANAENVVAIAKAEWELMPKLVKEVTYNNSFSKYAKEKLSESGFTAGEYEVIDKGNVYKYPVIPAGFVASDITDDPATINEDETENMVSKGLVIYEGTDKVSTDQDAKETRNQFVWVPVDDINEFVRKDFGIEITGTDFTNECTEPFSKTYNGVTLSLTNDLTEEYAEYKAMKSSVTKYGGFYIGRYEAGSENNTLVVKKGAEVWNYISWGTSIIDIGTSGAVYKSRKLYLNTATIKDSVVSHLIYGVEWDAALNFISKTDSIYAMDSTDKGNYNGVLENTGYYAVNNIYDMAGSLSEWTMEAYLSNKRVYRGGDYNYSGSSSPAAYRYGSSTTSTGDYIGFRPSLYIK